MNKTAFKIWQNSNATANNIAMPFKRGSGAAAALGNFAANVLAAPICVPASLPFFGVAKLAEQFFNKEYQLIIPVWASNGSAPSNIVVEKISGEDIQIIVISDNTSEFKLPECTVSKDGWPKQNSLEIQQGSITWICEAWDDRRNSHVQYFLLMQGIVPKIPQATLVASSQLDNILPKEVLEKIRHHPNYFEFWKHEKFNITFV